MPFTTIRIDDEVRDKLRSIGKMGESYNEVIKRLLEAAESAEMLKEDRAAEAAGARPIRPSNFG